MQIDPTSQVPPGLDADPVEVEKTAPRGWSQLWERLVRLGLGEIALRVGTGLVSIVLIFIVLWVMGSFYLKGKVDDQRSSGAALAAALPTATPTVAPPAFAAPPMEAAFTQGITRLAQLHTTLPSRPRFEISTYTVEKGDTIMGIAEKFGLRPQTILWGNYYTLADDPHKLREGQELNILPVDGVYYQWSEGDGLNGVARFFGVSPEEIINFQGNHLDANALGDWSKPNIAKGTWLIIPGGEREFVSWSAPRISRTDPAVAKIMGPGYCGQVVDGLVGSGTYVWPTVEHYLSGFDYSPETNHYGLDIAGNLGNAIYAADSGVVVYAGWNDWGYGNVVVIDHGNGWQTLYAHLSSYTVACGTSVTQGQLIAGMGSTGNSSGPHLHFEMRNDAYKANPWDFLR
ncbi:MAG TPA: M23 family metallopeptidase [Anaerolineaceae bacterium]